MRSKKLLPISLIKEAEHFFLWNGKKVMAQKKSELQKNKFEKVILNNLYVF